MANYESGREALNQLIADRSGLAGLNEAATRFQLIDFLLEKVLGWEKASTNVEVHREGGYSDYELGMPPALLVEAKREGVHFTLPAGWDKSTAKLDTLYSASDEIERTCANLFFSTGDGGQVPGTLGCALPRWRQGRKSFTHSECQTTRPPPREDVRKSPELPGIQG